MLGLLSRSSSIRPDFARPQHNRRAFALRANVCEHNCRSTQLVEGIAAALRAAEGVVPAHRFEADGAVVRPINLLDLHFDGQCLGPSREIRAAIVAHAHPESLTDVQLRLQSEDVWRRYTSARMIPLISWGLG